MANSAQTLNPNQKQETQKDQYASQSNPGFKKETNQKIGNNVEKDEPTAKNNVGGMKTEGTACASNDSSQGKLNSTDE